MSDWDNTIQALDDFGRDIIKRGRTILTKKGRNTQLKSLYNSLERKVVQSESSVGVQILMLDYGKFVDLGVKGHMTGDYDEKPEYTGRKKSQRAPNSPYGFKVPPGKPKGIQQGFKNWFQAKPYSPRGSGGRFISHDQGAFVMSRSARKYGLEPSYFMKDALEQALPRLIDNLGISVSEDIVEFFETNIKK